VLGKQLDPLEGGSRFAGQADRLGCEVRAGRGAIAEPGEKGRKGVGGGQLPDVLAAEVEVGGVHVRPSSRGEAGGWRASSRECLSPGVSLSRKSSAAIHLVR